MEWAGRNPDWWCGIQLLVVKSESILGRIGFSKSFAMVSDTLMGRKILRLLDLYRA